MIKRYLLLLISIFLPILGYSQIPTLHDNELEIRAVTDAPFESVRLSYNHSDKELYLLTRYGQIMRVGISNGALSEVQTSTDHNLENVQGMDIASDGTFYIVGNERDEVNLTNVGIIKRGKITEGEWQWTTVAETEPYPLSNTFFDHVMNGIVVSPDGEYLYINSGSRTDHGEVHTAGGRFPDTREVPLTAVILRVPADASGLLLENDSDFLRDNGYLFADGTRNSFSLAFNKEGRLFATENAGERDDPDELNWIREGHHYGFPWVMGGNENPMQFDGYVPEEDLLLPTETGSYDYFYNDPDFPAPPEGVEFTPGIPNYGPDAVNFRDPVTGEILSAAAEDTSITSFTGHRSPLGLVFDTTRSLHGEYEGGAFALGFTSGTNDAYLLRLMNDPGEDLLHLRIEETENGYAMSTRTIVSGFISPVDSELINNRLYVVEHKNPQWLNPNAFTQIWEVTFPGLGTQVDERQEIAESIQLYQNYPNPFNPATVISYQLPSAQNVSLKIYDMLGREIATLADGLQAAGTHQAEFDASNLSSGVYIYRLHAGESVRTRKMVLMK